MNPIKGFSHWVMNLLLCKNVILFFILSKLMYKLTLPVIKYFLKTDCVVRKHTNPPMLFLEEQIRIRRVFFF